MWELTPLSTVLVERREIPDPKVLAAGKIQIVSKIGFDEGKIRLRSTIDTQTDMKLIYPGDLVISGINATKGAIAVHSEGSNPIAATIHYSVYTPLEGQADVNFLWWFFRSKAFIEFLAKNLNQGIKTELRAKHLLSLKVPLPKYNEQLEIVNRLNFLIPTIKSTILHHEESAQKIKLIMVSAMQEIGQNLKKKQIQAYRLGNITVVTSGGTPDRNNPSYWGGPIPWIKSSELKDGIIDTVDEYITLEGLGNSSAKLFPPDTVLVGLYGQGQTRGRTAILAIESSTNQACAAILPKPELYVSRYLQYWLRSLYYEMRMKTRDGAQPNWNSSMIKDIDILIPSLCVQDNIISYLDSLELRIKELKKLHDDIGRQLNSLLLSTVNEMLSEGT